MGERAAFRLAFALSLIALVADVDAAARKGRRRATRDFPVSPCPVHLGKSVDGETGLPIPDSPVRVRRECFESRQTLYEIARDPLDCYQDGTGTFSKSAGSFFSEALQCSGVSSDCRFLDNFDDPSASASRWELDAAQLEGGQLVLAREDRGGVCTEATVGPSVGPGGHHRHSGSRLPPLPSQSRRRTASGPWFGFDPDGHLLILRDTTVTEVFAFDYAWP
jgi:hypothetical protein